MPRWDKSFDRVDPLVLQDIEKKIEALSIEDKYFLHFLLRHFQAVKAFFKAVREYSL